MRRKFEPFGPYRLSLMCDPSQRSITLTRGELPQWCSVQIMIGEAIAMHRFSTFKVADELVSSLPKGQQRDMGEWQQQKLTMIDKDYSGEKLVHICSLLQSELAQEWIEAAQRLVPFADELWVTSLKDFIVWEMNTRNELAEAIIRGEV